jgi:GNAT superfamily N-acetyltransferase
MVKIRKAKLKEVDEVVKIWLKFMEEHREMGRNWKEDRIPKFKEDAPEMAKKYFSLNIRSKNGLLLVLEDNGQIQGYMLSRIMKNIPIFEKDLVGEIGTLYLEKTYRGKGYSSKMFTIAKDWFNTKGISEILIRVMCCNPHAYEIYSHWGFKEIHIEMRLDR